MLGWRAVDGLDWSCLMHAYGPATDTEAHLHALTGDDLAATAEALDHLSYSVAHQYSCYPATAPALRVVGGLLLDPAVRRDAGPDNGAVLVELLVLVDFVAQGAIWAAEGGAPTTTSLTWSEVGVTPSDVEQYFGRPAGRGTSLPTMEAIHRLQEWSIVDLFAAMSELVDPLVELLDDPDLEISLLATYALARVASTPVVAARRPEILAVLEPRVDAATSREECAALVVGIGELGGSTRPWLEDDDEPIRACSAVYLPHDPVAEQVLVDALTGLPLVQDWFTEPPWRHQSVRERMLEALLAREVDFPRVLPVALTVADDPNPVFPDHDWGLLLLHAFPEVPFEPGVQPPPPTSLDTAQRAYLDALVANDLLWAPTNGNAQLARMRAGIPQTQREVRALLDGRPLLDPEPDQRAEPRRRGWWRRR